MNVEELDQGTGFAAAYEAVFAALAELLGEKR
jgi:hypothetical protein